MNLVFQHTQSSGTKLNGSILFVLVIAVFSCVVIGGLMVAGAAAVTFIADADVLLVAAKKSLHPKKNYGIVTIVRWWQYI